MSTPSYYRWRSMVGRCTNPRRHDYARYGGRGITVCKRWLTFENYEADLARDIGPRPSPGHQLDRIDNSKGYEPGNVRWCTRIEQVRNRRTTKFVEWNGLRLSVPEWAERLGLPQDTLYHRLDSWSVERALTTPLRRGTS